MTETSIIPYGESLIEVSPNLYEKTSPNLRCMPFTHRIGARAGLGAKLALALGYLSEVYALFHLPTFLSLCTKA